MKPSLVFGALFLELLLLPDVFGLVASLLLPKRPPRIMTVDLRSDTITRPTPAMRKAMAEAEVGDDVFGEDPTVNKLEERVALMFGKERSLFFPTGTMSNLAATMAWCDARGSEVILGDSSHMYLFEQSNMAQIAGVSPRVVTNRADGTMDIGAIEAAIRADNVHFPETQMIAIENTHNYCGGRVLPGGYAEAVRWLADRKDLAVHMDGARIWNAATASGTTLAKLAAPVDSLSACLSKGLGAPSGSLLVGPSHLIDKARRIRKALGGGMRQVGVLAAAGMRALDDFESGMLETDHKRAAVIAMALSSIPGIRVDPETVDTNIVIIHLEYESEDPSSFAGKLKERGVLVLPFGPRSLRLCTHRDIRDEDLDTVIWAFRDVAARAWTDSSSLLLTSASGYRPDDLFDSADEESIFFESGLVDTTHFEGENVLDADMRDVVEKEEKEEEVVVSYEEVQVRAMSVSDDGFCVFLQGTVSDRCVKVLVMPEDPMSEGLDREEVETSEAVTLLQLLQGIDVETYLAKDALMSQFKGDAKQKYELKLVLIEDVDGSSGEDKAKVKTTFQALLAGSQKRSENDTNTTASSGNKELLSPVAVEVEAVGGRWGRARPDANLLPVLDIKSGKTEPGTNTDAHEGNSTVLTRSGFAREVNTKSAFFAIALALRCDALIEVRSDLLEGKHSFSPEELKASFPKIKETLNPLPTTRDDATILARLKKRLVEAVRQGREDKVLLLQQQITSFDTHARQLESPVGVGANIESI
ncbi:pyridoxal phosphate-dependent transferase [Ochromonadaceae sp. CCMP2298]|nr:pyridoxal phosphate-dependent transferase [Ochromonadaceae sp. CCMP2298]|mmetsp:Transcript_19261/g.42935  ORF Transcript_19261/g.42935 Transcript_19261/m.42935 type:complete len:758 (-) Transcript_19261:287-2560(-)